MHEEDERPQTKTHMLIILALLTTGVIFGYWPLLQFLLSQNASEISWFHLPKTLFLSLQLKLIGTAQRWAQKRCETQEIAKLIGHSIFIIYLSIYLFIYLSIYFTYFK